MGYFFEWYRGLFLLPSVATGIFLSNPTGIFLNEPPHGYFFVRGIGGIFLYAGIWGYKKKDTLSILLR